MVEEDQHGRRTGAASQGQRAVRTTRQRRKSPKPLGHDRASRTRNARRAQHGVGAEAPPPPHTRRAGASCHAVQGAAEREAEEGSGKKVLHENAYDLTFRQIQELTGIPVVCGYVPYSKAGKGEGQEDPRDGIPAVLEAIEELLPLVVEIENVPEIQKYEGVVDSIVERLNSLGYWVSKATPDVDALLDEKARAAVGNGVLPDGRVVPQAVACTWEACHAVLTQVAAVVASGSAKAMSIDFEYTGGPRGRATGIALAQIAIGHVIAVLDVKAAPYLLAVSEFRGQPTLRHWLQAPHLLKITQSTWRGA
ncbi:hypothetical protein AB1Y20_021030 [Prymnesium parvum]|uniref:3'-5' exonuclease domain-containing protein n=1 Tax=Prymnesium parvum TaxID=97485 RepID=A0AB34JK50_PRYPA